MITLIGQAPTVGMKMLLVSVGEGAAPVEWGLSGRPEGLKGSKPGARDRRQQPDRKQSALSDLMSGQMRARTRE